MFDALKHKPLTFFFFVILTCSQRQHAVALRAAIRHHFRRELVHWYAAQRPQFSGFVATQTLKSKCVRAHIRTQCTTVNKPGSRKCTS